MKGKIELRFDWENHPKVRTRLVPESIPESFNKDMREIICVSAAEILNESSFELKQRVAEKALALGLNVKKEWESKLFASDKNFFDVAFATNPEGLDELKELREKSSIAGAQLLKNSTNKKKAKPSAADSDVCDDTKDLEADNFTDEDLDNGPDDDDLEDLDNVPDDDDLEDL